MSIKFIDAPIIGGVVFDENLLRQIEALQGVADSDLLTIYRTIGCGSFCRRIDLFNLTAAGPLPDADFFGEEIDLSGALRIGHECDGIDILATSVDRHVRFHTVVWSMQQVYSFASLEKALLGVGEISGLKGLYIRPFHVSAQNFTYLFEIGAPFEFTVDSIMECIGEGGSISYYYGETLGWGHQKNAWICNDSRELLLEVHDSEVTRVRLICDKRNSNIGKHFYADWLRYCKVAGGPPPERAI
ncbi:hypothetical protein [Verrucomicrobium sp. BvORR106]|uniref:hypothetical protein n=1 Tax=Verrucomicrobium sp. BvORR106 TaxID=1403819 RepID=UPI00056F39E1|nr:hypothetical protein [Verrucomicrobium sp. BvORR106]